MIAWIAPIHGYLMAGGYSVRVFVRLIFYFLFSLWHSNLDFFVIFMLKYDFIDIFFTVHSTLEC